MVPLSLIVFLVAAALTGANAEALNVTSNATDYYLLSQRELLQSCDVAQIEIDAVNARYEDELSVIMLQQGYILDEIESVNKTYTAQQALNINKKHCIQKNELQFVNADSANYRLMACYNTAGIILPSLTKNAVASLTSARYVASVTLPRGIATCNANYPSNQTKLEECYVREVTTATTNCNNYLYNVRTDLSRSLYDASVATNTAVKCSFAVEKDVLVSMGQAQEAIASCEQAMAKQGPRSVAAPQLTVSSNKLI